MFEVYADESCQTGHHYMVLGGLIVPRDQLHTILSDLKAARKRHNMTKEMKWEKISRTRLDAYMEYADVFFRHSENDNIHFHSVTINARRMDHKRFNYGDRELGFSKYIYQLLIKFGRLYASNGNLYCYLDRRTTKYNTDELQVILNNGIKKRWNISTKPFRRVMFRDSKSTELLQLNDILLGALASRSNGYHERPGASAAKTQMGEFVVRRAGIVDPLRSTPISQVRFTIWPIQMQ